MKLPLLIVKRDGTKDLPRALRFAQEALIAPDRAQARYFFSLARAYWARVNQ